MMSVLLLTEEDVRQVLTMEMALEAVEDGLRKMALDEAMNIPRARTQTDHAMQHVMSASAKSLGVMVRPSVLLERNRLTRTPPRPGPPPGRPSPHAGGAEKRFRPESQR